MKALSLLLLVNLICGLGFAAAKPKAVTPFRPQTQTSVAAAQPAVSPIAELSRLSPHLKCQEQMCQYYPQNIPSAGLDELLRKVSYEVFSNEYSDNAMMIAPEKDSIMFQNPDALIMSKIARSLIRQDVRPTFSAMTNSEVTLRFKVVRLDLERSSQFGYDLTGIFGKGAGDGKNDQVNAAGQAIGLITSPISSVLMNLSISQARQRGCVSEGDDIMKSYSNYEDMDLTQNQNKYRSDSAYDTVSESIGWRIGGKVIIGENGIVRINNLSVRYGVPTDETVATASANTLVESISFSNQVVELPVGYSKVLFSREVNLVQRSKESKMWILSKNNTSSSRRFKIYFVIEAGSGLNTGSTVQSTRLSADELKQLIPASANSEKDYLQSLSVHLPAGNQQYRSSESVEMGLERRLLDQGMASKVVTRSIKQIGSKEWVEKLKTFQGQDISRTSIVDLFDPQSDCVLNQNCEVNKFLVHFGLDPRVYGSSAAQAYYVMTFVPNADFVEAKPLSESDAANLDKNFVRTVSTGRKQ